jgi:hypothetical protein
VTCDSGNQRAGNYQKPPVANQFRPGQSGNPHGRPKGSRNLATVLDRELSATIVINENGKRHKVTKREALIKQLVNKAFTGDARVLTVLLNELRRPDNQSPTGTGVTVFQTADDAQVMENIMRRIRAADSNLCSEPGPDGAATRSIGTISPTVTPGDTR